LVAGWRLSHLGNGRWRRRGSGCDRSLRCQGWRKVGLGTAVGAAHQALAGQFHLTSAVGAGIVLDLGDLGRDQFATLPVHVAAEQVFADDVVDELAIAATVTRPRVITALRMVRSLSALVSAFTSPRETSNR
jgi:hypothetical protein